MADLIAEHPLDFVAHGFPVGGAEMDRHSVGSFPNFLHKRWAFVPLRGQRNRTAGNVYIDNLFIVHKELLFARLDR